MRRFGKNSILSGDCTAVIAVDCEAIATSASAIESALCGDRTVTEAA
jgi:hypothetical protein